MNVVVVGAAGQLGAASVKSWQRDGHAVTGLRRGDLDVTVHADVVRRLEQAGPEVVVNCAAYNQVDLAEDAPTEALAVNAWAVRSLARAAADAGAVFVHYSTDFVFDGETGQPYAETDRPNPRSAYGISKLLGEWLAEDAPRHYVLRVESLFGGSAARSTVDRMAAAFLAGRPVEAFVDRTVSPSFVEDVTMATSALVRGRYPFGLYHCVNSGNTTWCELAEDLRRLLGRTEVPIAAASALRVKFKAPRPLFAALSNAKLASAGVAMPSWQDALARYVASRPGATPR